MAKTIKTKINAVNDFIDAFKNNFDFDNDELKKINKCYEDYKEKIYTDHAKKVINRLFNNNSLKYNSIRPIVFHSILHSNNYIIDEEIIKFIVKNYNASNLPFWKSDFKRNDQGRCNGYIFKIENDSIGFSDFTKRHLGLK